MQTSQLKESMDILKDHGYKYTKKREQILQFLIDKDGYVAAKDVYDYLEMDYRGISYDTVYRNLHDFVELDLVEEMELNGEKKFRYHCCHGKIGHHHHFICTVCGQTKEIRMCPMDYFEEQLAGCQIEGHRFEIFGKCEKCAAKG